MRRKVTKHIIQAHWFGMLVDSFYATQKLRVSANNRIKGLERDAKAKKIKIDPNEIEKLHNYHKQLLTQEKALFSEIRKIVTPHPVWQAWLRYVTGIGPSLAGSILSIIETPSEKYGQGIAKFATISKLWAYAGFKPGQKRTRGKKLDYNPFLKTTCYKLGVQFIKQGKGYRDVYDHARAYYARRSPDFPLGKQHLMALRKTVKLFLSHLWLVWRELEGLPVSKPYALEKGGHSTYIEPIFDKKTAKK